MIKGVGLVLDDSKQIDSNDAYEARMAQLVDATAASFPSALVLVYSGNAHARKSQVSYDGQTYQEAAAHLSPASVVSIKLYGDPGMTWACEDTTCGPHSYTPPKAHHDRGLSHVDASEGYDAVIYTGTATTASPPAARPPTPEPLTQP